MTYNRPNTLYSQRSPRTLLAIAILSLLLLFGYYLVNQKHQKRSTPKRGQDHPTWLTQDGIRPEQWNDHQHPENIPP
jgi:hypothetical protein